MEGTIGGLNDNATGAATSLELTLFPAGLGGTLDQGNNVLAWSNQLNNSFTVTNGSITAADFTAANTSDGLCLSASLCFAGLSNGLTFDAASTNTGNNDGFSGVTFSSAATPVPFEVNPTLGLLLVGGLFGSNRLYRKHKGRKI